MPRAEVAGDGHEQGEPPLEELEPGVPVELDPLTRSLSVPGTPAALSVSPPATALADQVALQLVRRLSAGSSGKSSALRVEFSSGVLEGGSVLVTSDDGDLSISIDAPPGSDARALAERIHQRLLARGLKVAQIECS